MAGQHLCVAEGWEGHGKDLRNVGHQAQRVGARLEALAKALLANFAKALLANFAGHLRDALLDEHVATRTKRRAHAKLSGLAERLQLKPLGLEGRASRVDVHAKKLCEGVREVLYRRGGVRDLLRVDKLLQHIQQRRVVAAVHDGALASLVGGVLEEDRHRLAVEADLIVLVCLVALRADEDDVLPLICERSCHDALLDHQLDDLRTKRHSVFIEICAHDDACDPAASRVGQTLLLLRAHAHELALRTQRETSASA